jgi:hypothetical protein
VAREASTLAVVLIALKDALEARGLDFATIANRGSGSTPIS